MDRQNSFPARDVTFKCQCGNFWIQSVADGYVCGSLVLVFCCIACSPEIDEKLESYPQLVDAEFDEKTGDVTFSIKIK